MTVEHTETLLKRTRTRRTPNVTLKKELLSLAGEHRVASELCKRGIFATITPGNRKQTDLYAMNDDTDRFCRIEVKASQARGWVTGIHQRKRPGKPPHIWVLVLFEGGRERFFVLTNDEIVKLQKEENDKWLEGYRRRHDGREYDIATGVDNLPLKAVESAGCEDTWDKIVAIVGASPNVTSDNSVENVSG